MIIMAIVTMSKITVIIIVIAFFKDYITIIPNSYYSPVRPFYGTNYPLV